MAKILVIDDDEVIAELLSSVLTEGGHSVTALPSLEGELPPAVDLVITDLVTATPYTVSDAGAWVARVRERIPGAPVVVCTAHRGAANDGDGMVADAVLTKPFDLEALLGLVERFVHGSAHQARD